MMNARTKIGPLKLALIAVAVCALLTLPTFAADENPKDQATSEEGPKETVDFKALKNPLSNTKKSIGRGKMLFVRACAECHGPDGKALIDVIADATDLTVPKYWFSGTTQGEIFRSIRDGAGVSMPPFKLTIRREEDMWHLVNFIQSLWPKSIRPEVVAEESGQHTDPNDDES